MRTKTSNGRSAGILVVRILACLLLAASLAALLLPWASLRLDDGGERVTLREMAKREEQRSGQSFRERVLSRLSEQDEGLYAGLLRTMDPLLDDRMSPLRVTVACTGAARWLSNTSTAVSQGPGATEPETANWVQDVQASASKVKMTSVFLWVLLVMLLVTGAYAIYAAAVGYGFGTIPYLVCALPAFLGAVLAVSRANAWFRGASLSAGLMQAAVNGLSAGGNPVSVPFRLGLGAILFAALLVLGILLAMCSLEPAGARGGEAPRPVSARPEGPAGPVLAPKPWRCPVCGTLMGDGVYCVKCGSRKPEPRRCGSCGALLEEGALFCTACGAAAENRRSAPAEEPPARLISTMRTGTVRPAETAPVPQTLLWSGSRKEKQAPDPRIPDDSEL